MNENILKLLADVARAQANVANIRQDFQDTCAGADEKSISEEDLRQRIASFVEKSPRAVVEHIRAIKALAGAIKNDSIDLEHYKFVTKLTIDAPPPKFENADFAIALSAFQPAAEAEYNRLLETAGVTQSDREKGVPKIMASLLRDDTVLGSELFKMRPQASAHVAAQRMIGDALQPHMRLDVRGAMTFTEAMVQLAQYTPNIKAAVLKEFADDYAVLPIIQDIFVRAKQAPMPVRK